MNKYYSNNLVILIFIIILFLQCTLYIEKFVIKPWKYNEHLVSNIDATNRILIWEKTVHKFGLQEAKNIFPMTYILPRDIEKCINDNNKHFILKTLRGFQRKGVILVNNKYDIYKNKDDYEVAQVYINNPLLINKFKFDVRTFIVVDCNYGIYLYKNSYNVYTKYPFNFKSMDRDKKINQVFTEDSHYDENNLPRKFEDLIEYNIDVNKIYKNLAKKLQKVFIACEDICSFDDINNNENKYNIYGLDFEVLNNLDPIIIEVNSGPSLNFDEKWKQDITDNLEKYIIDKNYDKNFIKIMKVLN